jgi:CRISPR-associated exonuclease Cas4
VHAVSDLATVTYCSRQLYYRRDDERELPESVKKRRELAFEYEQLIDADDATLAAHPIEVTPENYRGNLRRAKDRLDSWDELVDPDHRDVLLSGRECRGIAQKVLEKPLAPSYVSPGSSPKEGVWKPQSVRAVALAKALSWEREQLVERAFVEYPAYGVIREISLTTRRKADYRRAIRGIEGMDGPPARLTNSAKCDSCAYRKRCGTRTRSLRSLLGL